MGNLLSCQKRVGNFVFLPDGKALPIESSMTAAELMLEHPSHFVAELTSGKPVPLPADYTLEVEKTYVVLPIGTRKVGMRLNSPPNMMKDESSEGLDCQSEILLQRQYSKRGWKPSLRTIEEWALVKKVPHWLF